MTSSAMRRLGHAVSRVCGVQRLLRLSARGPTVLFYHGVEENIADPDIQGLHTPLRVFEKQIAFLRRHREVISLDHLRECLINQYAIDPRQIVLTFDDGYQNNLRVVGPLLRAWALPFAVFVSTRHISEGHRFPTYYIRTAVLYADRTAIYLRSIKKGFDLTTRVKRLAALAAISAVVKRAPQQLLEQIIAECMEQLPPAKWADLNAAFSSEDPMSWQEVMGVRGMGATIGSHCHDHCILHANQPEEEVNQQLKESKALIEKNVAECKYMAYPNGTVDDISDVAYSAVKAYRFQACFTTIEGEVTREVDCYLVPRIFAVPEYEDFRYTLSRTGRENKQYFSTCLARTAGVVS